VWWLAGQIRVVTRSTRGGTDGEYQLHRNGGPAVPNADYSLPAGLCWPAVEARRLSIPAAAGRQWVPHAGVISPHFLLPLGYEHYDIRLPGLCTVLVPPADQPSRPAAGAWLEGRLWRLDQSG
jgi:hypothetical protein